ncbi:MAG: oligoendopeptidase F [Parachlamydiaceae bacterium]|nr:oligoendopeptidase F [Parachlamydiaceae bacterium]
MVVERSEVDLKDRWNVEALFPNLESWQVAYDTAYPDQKPRWPEIEALKGHLGDEDPEVMKAALDLYFSHDRLLSALYTYAHLRHDEDITHDDHKVAFSRITAIAHDFAQETAWIEPELISLPENTLNELIKSPQLKDYRFHLDKIIRLKKHTLPPEQEEIMARTGKAMQTPYKAFSAINDADFKFNKVEDSNGNELELTHSLYGMYIRGHDRPLRENAFMTYHNKYMNYENTLCELLNGQLQSHIFNSRVRHYSSSLEAALFPKNIDVSVYHSLIKAVSSEIGSLHKYMGLRKEILGLEELHLYDVYVPLTEEFDMTIPYDEAEDLIIESVAPLGTQYQEILKKGLKNQRWVDRYENKNKRSGGYSSGSYDTLPYILMNYKGQIKDLLTLAHEIGHSMHSVYTHMNQPYQYGSYPIFLAEVASTFNEELLGQLLLKRAKSTEERIYLINQKIEDIRGTLFRQTMFAEFELMLHELLEKDQPLTPQLLRQKYRELNQKYFGPDFVFDREGEIEWARIPHFYYNFYVFQYATGISAALALADQVTKGGKEEQQKYLTFLSAGCSQYPIEILKNAGVDMGTPGPVKTAISRFSKLVDELEELLGSKKDSKSFKDSKSLKR